MNGIDWLRHISQQIKTLDHELHAALRIFVNGELEPEHLAAFVDASLKRERMMAQVLSYLAEQRKRLAMERYRAVRSALAENQSFVAPQSGDHPNSESRDEIFIELQGAGPSISVSNNGTEKLKL